MSSCAVSYWSLRISVRHFGGIFGAAGGLAASNVAAGALLVLNVWFYLTIGIPGVGLLAIVFGYLFCGVVLRCSRICFPMLVEFDQPIRRVWRNAPFHGDG